MALSPDQVKAINDRFTRIDQAFEHIHTQLSEIKGIVNKEASTPPVTPPVTPPPTPTGEWLTRITKPASAVTGPDNLPDVASTYSGKKLSVQELMKYGWDAGFRTPEDLQILAAIALAESGGDQGCRNWHPEYGFKVAGEPEHLMMPVPAGVRSNGLLMRSDRGAWQISDHWYPGAYDAECDDPATAAKIVKWIKENRGGWMQWDTYKNGAYKNQVPLATAQAFVTGPH